MNAAWESLFDGSLTLSDEQIDIDALAELPARRGVLLFADAHHQPVQLVQTANMRGLSRSRLTALPDPKPQRKADLSGIVRRIYYACCSNDFERHLLYQRLTHTLFGRNWKHWLVLPRQHYAALDAKREFPFFALTGSAVACESRDLFGPFANRRAAARFCDSLNIAFELCRSPALLESGNPQSCPYRQMQSCHGLCCREHGRQHYASLVSTAVRCAEGRIAETVAEFRQEMKQAASKLQFETAQLRKKQAERLTALLTPDFAWAGRLSALRIVVVVKGEKNAPEGTKKKVQHYQLWYIDAGSVRLLGMFAEDDPETLQGLLDNANTPAPLPAAYPYALSRQEHLAAIGWFLYRANRPGLWVNAAIAMPRAETIMHEIGRTGPADSGES